MSEVRPFGVGSEAVSEVSRFLACEVRPLPMWNTSILRRISGKESLGLEAESRNRFNAPVAWKRLNLKEERVDKGAISSCFGQEESLNGFHVPVASFTMGKAQKN